MKFIKGIGLDFKRNQLGEVAVSDGSSDGMSDMTSGDNWEDSASDDYFDDGSTDDGAESFSEFSWDDPEVDNTKGKSPTKELNKKPSELVDQITDDMDSDKPQTSKSAKKKEGDSDEESEESEDGKEADEEGEEVEKKPEGEEKKASPKGKKNHYVKVNGETFAIDANAEFTATIAGEKEPVTLQTLLNEYSGKKYAERQIAEYQRKESARQIAERNFQQTLGSYHKLANEIRQEIDSPEGNPINAVKKFLDSLGYDSYDLIEKAKIHQMNEVAMLMGMSEVERKAYLLEKRNKHLTETQQKRIQEEQQKQKFNSYVSKVDQLRKSYNVTEDQYLEAYEELSEGNDNKFIPDEEIVKYAAQKPYILKTQQILKPLEGLIPDENYTDIVYTILPYVKKGVSKEKIVKMVRETFSEEEEIQEINKKFAPIGKPKEKKQAKVNQYESFDDFND